MKGLRTEVASGSGSGLKVEICGSLDVVSVGECGLVKREGYGKEGIDVDISTEGEKCYIAREGESSLLSSVRLLLFALSLDFLSNFKRDFIW